LEGGLGTRKISLVTEKILIKPLNVFVTTTNNKINNDKNCVILFFLSKKKERNQQCPPVSPKCDF
jgi:hypothetical protein